MTQLILALALALFQDAQENKEECKKALDTFHAATKGASESARIGAINELSHHVCSLSISAIAPYLGADSEGLRVAAAKALGAMDHPKSLEVLSAAVSPNEHNKAVFEAVAKALEKLDWEAGAEALNPVLAAFHEKSYLDPVQIVIPVLGKLGSAASVEPLINLLEHVETEGKSGGGRVGRLRSAAPNKALAALEAPIKNALQQITGGNQPNYSKWKDWWRANRESLIAQATIVYRCKATGKRWAQKAGEPQACPNHDKPEKDGQAVKVLLHSKA